MASTIFKMKYCYILYYSSEFQGRYDIL